MLGILEEPGRVRLLRWDQAEPVLRTRRSLVERNDLSAEELNHLVELEATYYRVPAESLRRLTLHKPVLMHLGVVEETDVFVVRLPESLELWSPSYRAALLGRRNRLLEDLP
jgi:hypothetical protein